MSDMHDQDRAVALGTTAINRRKVMGGMAVLTAASTVATPAFAAVGGGELRTFHARYAVLGGRTLTGFFAAPAGKTGLDVVLVVPANDGEAVEDIARGYAQRGFLAIAPDFTKSQGAASVGASRDTKVAEVMQAVPGLKKLPFASGRVTVVAA